VILIATPKNRSNLAKFTDLQWVYIGSYQGKGQTKGLLDQQKRRFIGRDIEEIVDFARDNFVDSIGKISQYQDDKILWYSSRMASKSMSQTSMFHQYVYLKLLEKFLGDSDTDTLLVTDDDELVSNIKKAMPENVRVLSQDRLYRKKIFERIKGVLRILRLVLLWFFFHLLKNKKLSDFNLLIHTWIDDRTFAKLPEFNDSYLGDLGKFLTARGYSVGRLSPLRPPLKSILKLRKWFENIIHPLSYLTLSDLIRCVFTKFTVAFDKDTLSDIKDSETLSTLVQSEIEKENNSKKYLDYLVLFYAYKKIASRIKNETSIIYPFENQPWEKMLNLAFDKKNRLGYQHSTIPFNWLDYQVSQHEKATPLPQTILTAGKKWLYFLKNYYKDTPMEEAGAIRYAYLFNKEVAQKQQISHLPPCIVVALPISSSISLSMLKQLLNSLEKNKTLSNYILIIKPHPYLPKQAQLREDFTKYKNCQFSSQSINELLENCGLLITSGSTVAFESIFFGVKTLYFIPEEISLGLEHFIKDHLFIAYEEDFSGKLEEALESTNYPEVDIKEYFVPPNYEKFLKYL